MKIATKLIDFWRVSVWEEPAGTENAVEHLMWYTMQSIWRDG